jgi:hypothetical protein
MSVEPMLTAIALTCGHITKVFKKEQRAGNCVLASHAIGYEKRLGSELYR